MSASATSSGFKPASPSAWAARSRRPSAATSTHGGPPIGDSEALGSLTPLLDDPHPHLRGAAAWAVGRLGDRCVVPRLRAMLGDEDGDVREAAGAALARLR